MIVHGICFVISSYVFGWMVKYISRIGCFIIAAFFNYGMIILMYLWPANNNQMIILCVIAGVWGTADAIWQSQVIGRDLFSWKNRSVAMYLSYL
jgi:predicted MFS family arabinose efflux permease